MSDTTHAFHSGSQRALTRSLAPFAECGEATNGPKVDLSDIVRVRAAIRKLPERQRAILLGVRLHDRSLREIGSAWGLSQEQAEREFAAALIALMRRVEFQRGRRTRRR